MEKFLKKAFSEEFFYKWKKSKQKYKVYINFYLNVFTFINF